MLLYDALMSEQHWKYIEVIDGKSAELMRRIPGGTRLVGLQTGR